MKNSIVIPEDLWNEFIALVGDIPGRFSALPITMIQDGIKSGKIIMGAVEPGAKPEANDKGKVKE